MKEELLLAISNEDVERVKSLLPEIKSTNFKGKYGNTPYHAVIKQNNIEVTKLILSFPEAKIDYLDIRRETALFSYISKKPFIENLEVIHLFLECGANVNFKKSKTAFSLLHLAMMKRNLSLVKLLIDYGADINEQSNKDLWSPIFFTWSLRSTKLLIDHGADTELIDKHGNTLLSYVMRFDKKHDPLLYHFNFLYEKSTMKDKHSYYLSMAEKSLNDRISSYLKKSEIPKKKKPNSP